MLHAVSISEMTVDFYQTYTAQRIPLLGVEPEAVSHGQRTDLQNFTILQLLLLILLLCFRVVVRGLSPNESRILILNFSSGQLKLS
jgi:hypothetical protein